MRLAGGGLVPMAQRGSFGHALVFFFFFGEEDQLVKVTYIFIPLAERMTHVWTRLAGRFAVYKRTRSAGYAAVLFGL